jgi:hypothetical protein
MDKMLFDVRLNNGDSFGVGREFWYDAPCNHTYALARIMEFCETQSDCDAVQHTIQAALDAEREGK